MKRTVLEQYYIGFFLAGIAMFIFVGCGARSGMRLPAECGDGICRGDEDAENCPEDCAVSAECGDGICQDREDETNCPEDCYSISSCGNGICEEWEDEYSCPDDCSQKALCGDGSCGEDETPYNCPEDCAVATCGNGICDGGENEETCPQDCSPDGCGNGVCERNETPASCPVDCTETGAVDVLFVVDNSSSMLSKQMQLRNAFPVFFEALNNSLGMIPDIQVGVVTTDLGIGGYSSIRYCEELGGDGGIMGKAGALDLGENCLGSGQRYMVDVEPEGCFIERGESGQCFDHGCTQQNCDDEEVGQQALTLSVDVDGCPRCRNFEGEPQDAFSCLADVGVQGCGFEQPLEALRLALNADTTPQNEGFLRDDAVLVVVLVTDEDDCSASDPDTLYDPDPSLNNIDSTVGYLHSFRCFEFGVTCDINDRTVMGPRLDCEPREDENALLHPISRYVEFLGYLKDPGRMKFMSLAGPVPQQIVVALDETNRPELEHSCYDSTGHWADPAIRLEALTARFNPPASMNEWAFYEICENSFLSPLEALGEEVKEMLGH